MNVCLIEIVEKKVGKKVSNDNVLKYGLEYLGENILQPTVSAFVSVLASKYF
jgi:hypothetical protein